MRPSRKLSVETVDPYRNLTRAKELAEKVSFCWRGEHCDPRLRRKVEVRERETTWQIWTWAEALSCRSRRR
jgi:hypothetical protein